MRGNLKKCGNFSTIHVFPLKNLQGVIAHRLEKLFQTTKRYIHVCTSSGQNAKKKKKDMTLFKHPTSVIRFCKNESNDHQPKMTKLQLI